MKLLIVTLIFVFSNFASAEITGSWSCAGKTILLMSKMTYLKDTNFTQVLYTLRRAGTDKDSTEDIGYFLNAVKSISPCTRNFKSTNDVGGSFDLTIKSCEDEDDGEGIPTRNVASGTLKYSHGPLQGEEGVTCVFE